MLRNRFYYWVKPFLPWSVRMPVRRSFAQLKRERVRDVWPILPGSEKPPVGWPGWPEGKQFSFVLTHDVEGPEGLAKVKPLAELEMSLGFRSCFNFIPEGAYRVTRELRDWLASNGFEVGVHDLNHDGKLYRNPRDFAKKARRINQYLKDWDAVGFRSGFMLRNLDWLHQLNVQYEASTFDTDPFEPQPHGTGTIFPFWVARRTTDHIPKRADKGQRTEGGGPLSAVSGPVVSSNGYVELPYTLAQDSTLFLLLREKTPAIWLQKLDWIAQHGGMALVNVHPDYLQFEGAPPSARTYPVARYEELLRHIQRCQAGRYWQALPRRVGAFVAGISPQPVHRRSLRVCMVTHSYYSRDNRVIRYAESLASRGDQVDVLSLRSAPDAPPEECINGVNVFRLQDRFSKHGESAAAYLLPILRFFATASLWITRRHGRGRYDVFHIHNIPDFLVFAAWYPRLRGAKTILDVHDVVPEFFASKFSVPFDSWRIRSLLVMERWSARFAHHVIIANHLWLDKYVARSARADKCSVFINNVDSALFHPRPRTRTDNRLIVMFPGGLHRHQGLDIAIRAFQKVSAKLPRAEFHIYGDGNMKPQLVALAAELGLNGNVRFFDPVRVQEIAQVMADADLGVVPKRADSFGNEAYSTKIMEFMSLGVPVVVSNTKIDRFYFNDSLVRFFESGNPAAMAEGMIEVLRDCAKREQMIAHAREYAVQNSWDSRKADYLKLVDDLCQR